MLIGLVLVHNYQYVGANPMTRPGQVLWRILDIKSVLKLLTLTHNEDLTLLSWCRV